MKRQPRQTRAQRRAQERKEANATIRAICAYQVKQGNRARTDYDRQTARTLEQMQAKVRTLKLDEQAKARAADSQGQVILDAAKLNEHPPIEETAAEFCIPRESLTNKLYLRLFPPVLEFRDETTRTLDKASKDRLAEIHNLVTRAHPDNRAAFAARLMAGFKPAFITVTNPRYAGASDQTLLTRQRVSAAPISVFRQTRDGRTFEQETADLPRWCAVCNALETKHTAADHKFTPALTD